METKTIADFIVAMRYEDLDERTLDRAKMCIQDLIGVAVAGSASETGRLWERHFFGSPSGAKELATCWNGSMARSGYREVAGFNAACGHLLDLDDLHNSSIAHLGTVTIPAAMAIGQKRGLGGKEVLTAIVAGYETGARVGEAINPGAYRLWHTTGVVGTFSSSAASGKLLNLTSEQMLDALGNAGTQSAGLWEFIENGSMSKSLHTANAVLCGIRSAELASIGFTGAHTILEGGRGLVAALDPEGDPGAAIRGLGRSPFKILGDSFKPYACCRHTHSACAAARRLLDEDRIAPAQIERIIDHTYRLAKNLADNPDPTTPYSHKFSIQYCVAAMLLYGDLMGDAFSVEKTSRREARDLMSKIQVVEDPALQAGFEKNPDRWPHVLEIRLKNGRTLSKRVDYPPGDFMNPFTWEDADKKFLSLTDGILSRKASMELMERVRRFEEFGDVNDFLG